ncbi:MAG: hypothetical protein ABI691_25120 [Ginsengibacter sp.]
MPDVYEKANLTAAGPEQWDFKKYTPNIISIALGTNDFSRGDGKKLRLPFDSATFVNHYTHFVELIKSKYPLAQIALLSSSMVHGDSRNLLQNCLTAVKQNIDAAHESGKKIALYFFNPMQAHGCAGHPIVEEHAILANELSSPEQIMIEKLLLKITTESKIINVLPELLLIVYIAEV